MSSRLSGSWDRIGSQRTSFRDGEPDVVSRGLVVARRVANESLELGQRPILDAAIDIEDAHQTPLPEGPAGFPKGENFRSVTDPGSADGAMAGAMEESQRTPPSKASTRSQTIAPMMRAPSVSNARAETRDWSRFMGSTEDFQDEVAFHPVTVLIAGNGRIISKDRDPVGERIPVDVVEIPFDETDGRFDVGDAEGGDVAARDALGDRGAEGLDCGGIHWIFWPRFSERGRHGTTESDGEQQKNLGDRQDYFAAQSGGMMGTSETVPKVQGKRKGWKVQGIRRSNPNKKNGPDPKEIADPDWARVLDGASLGIPFERLCHLAGMSEKTFAKYLLRHPERKEAIEAAKTRGEYDLTSVVRTCGPGWQGSAWLLERTRGYVARASLEHTGKGGKDLSISGALLGAFGNTK